MASVKKEQIGFEIVRPIEPHARQVMEWRNDPFTLEASFHQGKKMWDDFWVEFCRDYFSFPTFPPVFLLYEGCRVGFLRFRSIDVDQTPQRKCCEVSINIAPEFRGKGIGKQGLLQLSDLAKEKGFDDLYAEVKSENIASHKVFLSAGYQDLGKQEKLIEGVGEVVMINQYVARLTPEGKQRDSGVFIIAEAGSNWRMGTAKRDHAMARALIDVAIEAGADAVKFQTFRPETVYVHNAGQSNYLADAGIMEDISNIFADLAIPYEMVHELAEYCNKCGIEFMSSPFSIKDFRVVDEHVQRHKIASYEISHIHLIELAAASGKPTIISTGASSEDDISWAVDTYYKNGGKNLTLLQCTAKYPSDLDTMNLSVLTWLQERYHVDVGLSDHSRDPILAPIAAVSLGAKVIEKHFTLSNNLPGPDHSFAVLPGELKKMVRCIRETEKMRGSGVKGLQPCETELRAFARRGVQALHDIKEGDILKEGANIAILRSGNQKLGVHPKYLCEMEGKKATRSIQAGVGIMNGDWK